MMLSHLLTRLTCLYSSLSCLTWLCIAVVCQCPKGFIAKLGGYVLNLYCSGTRNSTQFGVQQLPHWKMQWNQFTASHKNSVASLSDVDTLIWGWSFFLNLHHKTGPKGSQANKAVMHNSGSVEGVLCIGISLFNFKTMCPQVPKSLTFDFSNWRPSLNP